MLARAIDELGIQDRTILVSPVGCSVFAYYYFDVGNVQAAHGRAPAVATGLKRSRPGSIVIGYQGDGDLSAIGSAEILHAANRGENITVIFVNNAIYSMTGGQYAPTTLLGQKSTTTPNGRNALNEGYPLHVSELLATLEAPVYIERVGLGDNKQIAQATRAVRLRSNSSASRTSSTNDLSATNLARQSSAFAAMSPTIRLVASPGRPNSSSAFARSRDMTSSHMLDSLRKRPRREPWVSRFT
jgi:hypothetical protein